MSLDNIFPHGEPPAAAQPATAEALLELLLEDIYDVTHGNYDAETFRRRCGVKWLNNILAFAAVQAVAPAAALSPTPTALERQLEYLRTALRENLGLSKDAPDEDIIDQSGEHSEWLKNYETCMTTIAEAAGVRLNGSELQWSDMTRDVVAKLQSVALSPSEEPKK